MPISAGYECRSGSIRSNSLKLPFVSTSSSSPTSKGSSSSSFTGFQRRTEEDRVKASLNRPKVSRELRQGKAATLATLTSDAASMASSYHDRSDFDSRGLTSFLSSSTLPSSSETSEEEENSVLLNQLLGRYATFLENTKGYTAEVSGEPDKELTREKFKGPNIIEEDIATDLEEVRTYVGRQSSKNFFGEGSVPLEFFQMPATHFRKNFFPKKGSRLLLFAAKVSIMNSQTTTTTACLRTSDKNSGPLQKFF